MVPHSFAWSSLTSSACLLCIRDSTPPFWLMPGRYSGPTYLNEYAGSTTDRESLFLCLMGILATHRLWVMKRCIMSEYMGVLVFNNRVHNNNNFDFD